jgi:hypothetical protein
VEFLEPLAYADLRVMVGVEQAPSSPEIAERIEDAIRRIDGKRINPIVLPAPAPISAARAQCACAHNAWAKSLVGSARPAPPRQAVLPTLQLSKSTR